MKISNYRLLLWKTSNPCARYNLKCAPWEELSSLVPPRVEYKVMSMEAHKLSIRLLHTWWNIVVWFFDLGNYILYEIFGWEVMFVMCFKTWSSWWTSMWLGYLKLVMMHNFWMGLWTWIPFEVCISFCLSKVPLKFWHDGSLWLWPCTWSSLFNQTLGGL